MSHDQVDPATSSAGSAAGPLDSLLVVLATGLGLGRIPFAPGTWGSLLGLPVVWALQALQNWTCLPLLYSATTIALFLAGVPICAAGARRFGLKDPGSVVFDEIAALPVVFALVPLDWRTGAAGFLLFRLFDITKPPPIRKLEHLPGGWGVMADDALAGVYAGCLLTIGHRLFAAG